MSVSAPQCKLRLRHRALASATKVGRNLYLYDRCYNQAASDYPGMSAWYGIAILLQRLDCLVSREGIDAAIFYHGAMSILRESGVN